MTKQEALSIIDRKIDEDMERLNDLAMKVKRAANDTYEPDVLFHDLKQVMDDYKEIQARIEKFKVQRYAVDAVTEV